MSKAGDAAGDRSPALVTIGLPAYNRPCGLRRALNSLVVQTYTNIEIIVSDDGSPDPEVERIATEFASKDKRIKYFRHNTNIGPELNFKFVLDEAAGEFFMWAADDDERDPDCVNLYMKNIGTAGGVFSSYAIKDYSVDIEKRINIPLLNGEKKNKAEINKFYNCPCPSMVYGLYRTEVAKQVMPKRLFDFWDFYFCLSVISKHGIKTFQGRPLYFAGTDGKYKLNPFNKSKFHVSKYFIKGFSLALQGGYCSIVRHIKFVKWVFELNCILKRSGRLD